MSKGLNKCMFIGYVGRDPEIKHSQSGTTIANLSLGVDMSYKDTEKTEWVRLVAFGKPAETIGQYVKKGTHLYVEGRMETRDYEKQGVKCYGTSVVIEDFKFLGKAGQFDQAKQDKQRQSGDAPAQAGDDFDDDIPF